MSGTQGISPKCLKETEGIKLESSDLDHLKFDEISNDIPKYHKYLNGMNL